MSADFKPTVLIVDDEPDLLDIFKSEFEERGCRALTAGNGEEALELVKSNRIDVVITDICMPKMNGMDLLKAIEKSQGHRPYVVTMSGYSLYSPNDLYNQGSAGFIPKPIQYQQIVELIENYVLLISDQTSAKVS